MIPYAVTLGMEFLSASPEKVVGRLSWREELTTTGGAMHGGALISGHRQPRRGVRLPQPARRRRHRDDLVLDQLHARRARGVCHRDRAAVTVGRTVIVVQTDVRDDEGRLVGQTTQAQAVIGP